MSIADQNPTCSSKKAYETEEEAHRCGKMSGRVLFPYKCAWCGLWHLSKSLKAKKKVIKHRRRR